MIYNLYTKLIWNLETIHGLQGSLVWTKNGSGYIK